MPFVNLLTSSSISSSVKSSNLMLFEVSLCLGTTYSNNLNRSCSLSLGSRFFKSDYICFQLAHNVSEIHSFAVWVVLLGVPFFLPPVFSVPFFLPIFLFISILKKSSLFPFFRNIVVRLYFTLPFFSISFYFRKKFTFTSP